MCIVGEASALKMDLRSEIYISKQQWSGMDVDCFDGAFGEKRINAFSLYHFRTKNHHLSEYTP